MRKAKFTREDIIAAGKTLQSQGSDVSPNAIKLQLGGGNPTRIKQIWDEYHSSAESSASRKSRLDRPLSRYDELALEIDIPVKSAATSVASTVETVFESLLTDLTETMSRKLNQKLQDETSRFSLKVGELQGKLEFAEQEIALLKRYREDDSKRLKEKTKENADLEFQISSLQRQLEKLHEN